MRFITNIKEHFFENANYAITERKIWQYNFIECINGSSPFPTSGWKIHISANVLNAVKVLNKSLPILKTHQVSFKSSASIRDLEQLNTGLCGITQIGKFITIYPSGKRVFTELLVDLARELKMLKGPCIISDKPYSSIVYYRYGSFENIEIQTSSGLDKKIILSPSGDHIEDDRTKFYIPPWEADPFPALNDISIDDILNDRGFVILSVLQQNYKGSVFLAQGYTNINLPIVIIKKYNANTYVEKEKYSVRKFALKERKILKLLADENFCPKFISFFKDKTGNTYNVIEYIPSLSLLEVVHQQGSIAKYFEFDEIVKISISICKIFITISSKNIIYRDLKPGNILINESFKIFLTDFETCIIESDKKKKQKFGTKGFRSPQQIDGNPPVVQDDIYAFGAILYFMLTNANPSLAPRDCLISERPIGLLRNDVPEFLIEIVDKCLETEEKNRYKSFAEILNALSVSGLEKTCINGNKIDFKKLSSPSIIKNIAIRVYNTLKKDFYGQPETGWMSSHKYNYGINKSDFAIGIPGIASSVFLLSHTLNIKDEDYLKDVINLLKNKKIETDNLYLPGLFIGKSGLGLSFLLHFHLFKEKESLELAIEIADQTWNNLPTSFDLYNGLSGCGLFYLILYKKTGDEIYLKHATKIAKHIIAARQRTDSTTLWQYPDNYDSLSGKAFLGLAHGIAGIGYFLVEYYNINQDPETFKVIMEIFRSLDKTKIPSLNTELGANWPDYLNEDDSPSSIYWCNGAAGIGLFLAKVYALKKDKSILSLLKEAIQTIYFGSRYLNPTYCHGIAGNLDSLITIQELSGIKGLNEIINILSMILRTHLIISEDRFIFPSEEPTINTPDFLVGYSGIAYALLRMFNHSGTNIFSVSTY